MWRHEGPEQEFVSHGYGSIQSGGSKMDRSAAVAARSTSLSVGIQPVGEIVGRIEGRGMGLRAGHDSERRGARRIIIRRHRRRHRRHLHRLHLSSFFHPEHLQHHTQILLFKNK